MYKVIYTLNSYNKIDKFTIGFKNIYIKLFQNSGLIEEDSIIENYIQVGDKFNDLILDSIEKIFSQELIIGVSNKGHFFLTTISVNNFRLFVYYSEDIENKIRYIENIEFFKR